MTSTEEPPNIVEEVVRLLDDGRYADIGEVGQNTTSSASLLAWADEVAERILAYRYKPVSFREGDLEKIGPLLQRLVCNLERVANYCDGLDLPHHIPLDAAISEAYWHLLPERDLELADHYIRRAGLASVSGEVRWGDNSRYMTGFIMAERYLDGIGVVASNEASDDALASVLNEYEYDDLEGEGLRLHARLLFNDSPEHAAIELSDLSAEGYLAAFWDWVDLPDAKDNQSDPITELVSATDAPDGSQEPDGIDAGALLAAEQQKLANMIGLESVKAQVAQVVAHERVQAARRTLGLEMGAAASRHLVLTGNPGTGKTTVARILARIFYLLGVLSKDSFIETQRSDLVGGYLGQTAIKTMEVIKTALGGVLFIDEAYALVGKEDSFGEEAINTLLKAMEDHRADLIVIVAGYTEQMDSFLESNPGLRSRFNTTLHFEDYAPSEMSSILGELSTGSDNVLEREAASAALRIFEQLEETSFAAGNGRSVRNFFEKTIYARSTRISKEMDRGVNPTKEQLQLITLADVTAAASTYGVFLPTIEPIQVGAQPTHVDDLPELPRLGPVQPLKEFM